MAKRARDLIRKQRFLDFQHIYVPEIIKKFPVRLYVHGRMFKIYLSDDKVIDYYPMAQRVYISVWRGNEGRWITGTINADQLLIKLKCKVLV